MLWLGPVSRRWLDELPGELNGVDMDSYSPSVLYIIFTNLFLCCLNLYSLFVRLCIQATHCSLHALIC